MLLHCIRRLLPAALLLAGLASLAPAQVVDTLGGTGAAPSGASRGKGTVFQVDQTVLLLDYAMWLNVPAPDTVTFFCYRYHSRAGTYTLEWTIPVPVNGTGSGPSWVSPGVVSRPLVAGNWYVLGAAWNNSLTYYYNGGGVAGTPVSFGNWQRAVTTAAVPPATFNVATGTDSAVYHQQLTTIPINSVRNIPASCLSSTAAQPRLVADDLFSVGATTLLELVGAPASTPVAFAMALGPELPAPLSFANCNVWLQPAVTVAAISSSAGYAPLTFAVPPNPGLVGVAVTSQGVALGTSVAFTNAVSFVVN